MERVDGVPLLVHEFAIVEARDASVQCGIPEEVLAPLKAARKKANIYFVEPSLWSSSSLC